jgi:hypothetical protein
MFVNVSWYPVAEPAPEWAEEAVGAVPQAVDEPHVRRREVEWTDNLQKIIFFNMFLGHWSVKKKHLRGEIKAIARTVGTVVTI